MDEGTGFNSEWRDKIKLGKRGEVSDEWMEIAEDIIFEVLDFMSLSDVLTLKVCITKDALFIPQPNGSLRPSSGAYDKSNQSIHISLAEIENDVQRAILYSGVVLLNLNKVRNKLFRNALSHELCHYVQHCKNALPISEEESERIFQIDPVAYKHLPHEREAIIIANLFSNTGDETITNEDIEIYLNRDASLRGTGVIKSELNK